MPDCVRGPSCSESERGAFARRTQPAEEVPHASTRSGDLHLTSYKLGCSGSSRAGLAEWAGRDGTCGARIRSGRGGAGSLPCAHAPITDAARWVFAERLGEVEGRTRVL